MNLKGLQSFLGRHRKGAIIVSISVGVLLLVGIYAFLSVNMWANYKVNYDSWQNNLRKDVDAALMLPATTHEERSRKMTQFRVVSGKIVSAKDSLCSVSGFFSWQLFIPSVKTEKETCDQYFKTAEGFRLEMQKVITYLENEQLLTKTLASATAQATLTENSWDSQVTVWQGTVDALKKLPVGPEFKPVKSSAADVAQSIQSSWQVLIVAHKAKDKAKYLDAQAKLTQAYSSLSTVSATSTHQFDIIAKALQTAYQKAFGGSTIS